MKTRVSLVVLAVALLLIAYPLAAPAQSRGGGWSGGGRSSGFSGSWGGQAGSGWSGGGHSRGGAPGGTSTFGRHWGGSGHSGNTYHGGSYHGGYRGTYWYGGTRVYLGFPWWGWPAYPYGYYGYYPYSPYYPYYPYYYPSSPVVEPAPPVYAAPATPPQAYWYYCQDPPGYYPYVRSCAGGWTPVAPQPPQSPPTP